MQENICKKYGLERKEFQKAVDKFSESATSKFTGDINALIAILDLLCNGDIPDKEE